MTSNTKNQIIKVLTLLRNKTEMQPISNDHRERMHQSKADDCKTFQLVITVNIPRFEIIICSRYDMFLY